MGENKINISDKRSQIVKNNIFFSFILKGVGIIISLQIVPLTIEYISPTRYGIWLTLSSIITWLSYFDLGFAHGFRNRFAEARAKGDNKLAKEFVSTTYAVLSLLFSLILVVTIFVNSYINWGDILNLSCIYNEELQIVFTILACVFCVNIVASIFTTMLTADQKPALASLIQIGGQLLACICIYILTQITTGSLIYLALVFSGIPCLLTIIVSIIMFSSKKYKAVAPSFKYIRFSLIKKILGLGGQFFIIMISMLFIYQFVNIILTREQGPDAVTQYTIAYKYFNILNMTAIIILTPFWSAFTDAYSKKDFIWMKNVMNKLEYVWLLFVPLTIIMLFFSDLFYQWWIGRIIYIPMSISISVALYVLSQTYANVYMYLINGTSKVRMQLIVYVVFAVITIPSLNHLCKNYGVVGVLFIPTLVYVIQAVIGRIQLRKIINETDRGIWAK